MWHRTLADKATITLRHALSSLDYFKRPQKRPQLNRRAFDKTLWRTKYHANADGRLREVDRAASVLETHVATRHKIIDVRKRQSHPHVVATRTG